jgi:hypothetical protein
MIINNVFSLKNILKKVSCAQYLNFYNIEKNSQGIPRHFFDFIASPSGDSTKLKMIVKLIPNFGQPLHVI